MKSRRDRVPYWKPRLRAYKLMWIFQRPPYGYRSLFIGRLEDRPAGVWLRAESHPTKGYAFRPGWHCCAEPHAPHLSKKGRAWVSVDIRNYETINRPESQGGTWYLAQWMRILP